MRFSLKDLMWSVTLASLGLATVSMIFATGYWKPPNTIALAVAVIFVFMPGALFGAAAGVLCHRIFWGIVTGFFVQLFVMLGLATWMARLH